MYRFQRLAVLAARAPSQRSSTIVSQRLAAFSSNITYSGGQASEGQGGFYASGGVKSLDDESEMKDPRQSMLALAADVTKITSVMKELETLEGLLESNTDPTSGKAIEIKSGIKKLMTQPDVLESLNRLEAEGAPVWGLSSDERELIITAREKVNEC